MVDYPMFSLLLSTFHAYKLALTFLELEQVWAWTKDFGLGLGLVNFQKKKCFIFKMDLFVMSCTQLLLVHRATIRGLLSVGSSLGPVHPP